MTKLKEKYINRELSWLSFNERVLQEAEDPSVPLIERLRFLGIFSNNLDEFFRVRVATQRRMLELPKKDRAAMLHDPADTLAGIQEKVVQLSQRFEKNYSRIMSALKKEDVYFTSNEDYDDKQGQFVVNYFKEVVRPVLVPIMLTKKADFPDLKGDAIYLAVKLSHRKKKNSEQKQPQFAIIEIPTKAISRFLVLPQRGNKKYVMLLDDVIRFNLDEVFQIFDYNKLEAYTIKITRDAELDFDDDISESWMDKMEKSLQRRRMGAPVRFVYDQRIAQDLLKFILKSLDLSEKENIIPAGRYHNFKDFIGFPNIGAQALRNRKLKPQPHPYLVDVRSMFDCIRKQDILLNYPYQSFNYIIDLLREAAIDPKVTSIKINLYRVAKNSKVMNALVNAVKNGKRVTVVVELQARFDEANNLEWANYLQEEEVKVIFGVPGLKVHSKLILINRKEDGKVVHYAHIGTGNFHEGTATTYGDCSLLTSDSRITKEVNRVFQFFKSNYVRTTFRHLIVSPYNVRRKLVGLINGEIKNAKNGKEAYIVLKLNNLVDTALIKKLYDASKAGVRVKLIIRGICSLVPGVKGLSENIEVISIVDRFLEHARILLFCNGGDELYFITSADWMTRNLDNRIEVGTPIYDKKLQKILKNMLDIQWSDNVKARTIGPRGQNRYVKTKGKAIRSQIATYNYFKGQFDKK